MTDPSLSGEPTDAASILKTSDEILHGSGDEKFQSLEQRLASLERKVYLLSEAFTQLTQPQPVMGNKPKEPNQISTERRTKAERERKIKTGLKLFWEAKLDGKTISLKEAAARATEAGYHLESTALSKKDAKAYRKKIDDHWKKLGGIEGMKKNGGIARGKERFINFLNRTLK